MGYLEARKLDLALPLLEDTLKLMQARLGADHPETAAVLSNLGSGYALSGRMDLALPPLEQAQKSTKARLGADHPSTLKCTNNLAAAHMMAGKPDLALPLFEETAASVENARLSMPAELWHTTAANSFHGLIRCHEQLKQFDQADTWRRKWLALAKAQTGTETIAYLNELGASIASLLRRQKWAEAEPLLREYLAIREKQAPDAWQTFETKAQLGGVLLAQKKYADAEPLLLAGYEGLRQRVHQIPRQAQDQALKHVPGLLAKLYEAWGKPDEAARWRKER
jgi:tetratricopeptide (TPR) repeat protein